MTLEDAPSEPALEGTRPSLRRGCYGRTIGGSSRLEVTRGGERRPVDLLGFLTRHVPTAPDADEAICTHEESASDFG
jgi:hypothetical protein